MASADKGVDRRARRTRQALLRAFVDVASEKGIGACSSSSVLGPIFARSLRDELSSILSSLLDGEKR
jgi:hypothetical protein